MAEHTWEPVTIAALSSLDNLSFGVAFALKGVSVGILANTLVASINSAGMLATMLAGSWIVETLPSSLGSPDRAGNILAGCVYLCIGVWEVFRLVNLHAKKASKASQERPSLTCVNLQKEEESGGDEEAKQKAHLLLWTDRDGMPQRREDIEEQNSIELTARDSTADGDTEPVPPQEPRSPSELDTDNEPDGRRTLPSFYGSKHFLSRRVSSICLFRTPAVVRNFVLIAWCLKYDVIEWSRRRRRRVPSTAPPDLASQTDRSDLQRNDDDTKEEEGHDEHDDKPDSENRDDQEYYREIRLKEAFVMGLALTFSNVAAGLAAGAKGLDVTITIIASFAASFLFMALGQSIGRRLRRGATAYCSCSHNDIALVAALFFLGYGIYILVTV